MFFGTPRTICGVINSYLFVIFIQDFTWNFSCWDRSRNVTIVSQYSIKIWLNWGKGQRGVDLIIGLESGLSAADSQTWILFQLFLTNTSFHLVSHCLQRIALITTSRLCTCLQSNYCSYLFHSTWLHLKTNEMYSHCTWSYLRIFLYIICEYFSENYLYLVSNVLQSNEYLSNNQYY